MFTVLFADDSRNIRDFCQRELEKEGYRVIPASGAKAALVLCPLVSPDVVILDIRMPEMGGIEAARQLTRDGYVAPLIFYTAHKSQFIEELASMNGVECVEKAETLTELKAAIARALGRQGGSKQTPKSKHNPGNHRPGKRRSR